MSAIETIFDAFGQSKIAVIGDVMLDTYWWGKVDRISPEAPVPVVALQSKEYRIGGAGNVALNAQSLGAAVAVFSVIGDDEDGQLLTQNMRLGGVDTTHLITSSKRITTNKTRIISRNQQMLRLDHETQQDLRREEEDLLLQSLQKYMEQEKPVALLFEDYNKGVLTERVIQAAIALCKTHGVITAVDPKRKNFFAYTGVDIFKPNLKEVLEGLNIINAEVNPALLSQIHDQLEELLQHRISFITLSDKGVFYQEGQTGELVPAHLRNVADVSGAGDTVIAVAALVYAVTRDTRLMARVANIAGGLVCEEVGTVVIDRAKLLRECKTLLGE
jgi:D-glycero-beta-D-manno-heptose-7-phosphate kinase